MVPNMSWLCQEILSYTLIFVDYLHLMVYLGDGLQYIQTGY
jgi:hypothetical protein